MMKLFLGVLVFGLTSINSSAQQFASRDRSIGVQLAVGENQFATSWMYQYLWNFGKKNRFGAGIGLRLTNQFGTNHYYATAPARLTSGKTGPAVLFSEDIPANIDSVLLPKSQVNALNLSLNFQYRIHKKWLAGFNIDAVGFSFGSKQKGTYFSNDGSGRAVTAKPKAANLLLISDNDVGSLNSELYAAYAINSQWGIKAGLQYLFTEYKTDGVVQRTPDGKYNDRFRYKSSSVSIGVTYSLRTSKK